jgi:hypothetical protein
MIDESDLMGAAELRSLLGVSERTIRRYRQAHWVKGIHYVQPIQRVLYVKPMILDWLINGKTPCLDHQDAMEDWARRTGQLEPKGTHARSRKKAE